MKRCAGVALMLLVGLIPSLAFGTVYVVDPGGGGDYATIQEAFTAAANGDTILIRAGQYDENVACDSKCLTVKGAGAGVTVVTGVTDAATFSVNEMIWPPGVTGFFDLTIGGPAPDDGVVTSTKGIIEFGRCVVQGRVTTGWRYGGFIARDSTIRDVSSGGYGSTLENTTVTGTASFWGPWVEGPGGSSYCLGHPAKTTGCTIESVDLGCASLTSVGDHIGGLHADCWSYVDAEQSDIGSMDLEASTVELADCSVTGDIAMDGPPAPQHGAFPSGHVRLRRCLVQGNLHVDIDGSDWDYWGALVLDHNTFLGSVYCRYRYPSSMHPVQVRSNIVIGATHVRVSNAHGSAVVSHNDFIGGGAFTVPPDSVFANIAMPPLFCGSGDYSLQDCSPCIGAAHDGTDIGLYGAGCSCATVTEQTSWGRIKALYRQPSN